MGLRVLIVSGPRRSGKSAVIDCMVREICKTPPHYIRLAAREGSKKVPKRPIRPTSNCGVATATWLDYDPDSIFEAIPLALDAIHHRDRRGCVILEADSDPALRHAYPYDCAVFVMSAPEQLDEVFRPQPQAQQALREVLHDTAAFAREVYGLFSDDGSASDVKHQPDMSDSQIIRFVRSPLGHEVTSRIQLQPAYHGLIESDVVIVNTAVGSVSETVDDVVVRLERLVAWSSPDPSKRVPIFCCDPCDPQDPRRKRLVDRLSGLYATAGKG